MQTNFDWCGSVSSTELNNLHAEAFSTRVFTDDEWDWERQLAQRSLGWVTARAGGSLVGFVNVIGDGSVHAWIQDLMVSSLARRSGIGKELVRVARDEARDLGCEWLHVDFDDDLESFYFDACGFRPTNAGLLDLSQR